ncbi:MAG TPA: dihydropteroate synthase [Bacteroidaceae bacterium]|nr:dihydropteroate synthase [Bacteroidaceae bacterium]
MDIETRIIGILNVTPDSFFNSSRKMAGTDIVKRVKEIVKYGGAVIDIGACSTRPDSQPATLSEETERLRMALPIIRETAANVPVSVDTFRPEVAEVSIFDYGVSIINDISGGNEKMYRLVGASDITYVLTYNRRCDKEILNDMLFFFTERLDILAGFGAKKIILDPGFGFSKTIQDNYLIMKNIDKLRIFGLPIMVGVSRKSMIYKLVGGSPEQALNGTTVLNTIAAISNVNWLRVHDVREAFEVLRIVSFMNNQ